jgi:hypothetical protein
MDGFVQRKDKMWGTKEATVNWHMRESLRKKWICDINQCYRLGLHCYLAWPGCDSLGRIFERLGCWFGADFAVLGCSLWPFCLMGSRSLFVEVPLGIWGYPRLVRCSLRSLGRDHNGGIRLECWSGKLLVCM